MKELRSDCRHVNWDRPCAPHKREGVKCGRCPHCDTVQERLIIIKLDALGDVLRTTCILPALRQKYPRAHVTWVTDSAAVPLLENNPYIDRRIAYGPDALAVSRVERFDVVFCLDAAPRSATLAATVKAGARRGFYANEYGHVIPCNDAAAQWLRLGLFDDGKKANARTWQDFAMDICDVSGMPQEIVLRLTDEEKEFTRRFAEKSGLQAEGAREFTVIGLNPGSGGRWPMKQWPVNRCIEFIRVLSEEPNVRLLLFGGEEEAARNHKIVSEAGAGLIDTGCGNTLREFFALLDLCDIVVTTDSLALHAALGLEKKVVALFGPTSAAEIDCYGRGIKVVSDMECACCYHRECDIVPSCMDRITPARVFDAVQRIS